METIDLSDFFKTKAQAQDFAVRLNVILDKIYETNFNFEKALVEAIGMEKKDKFMALLRNHNITVLSGVPLRDFLTKLLNAIPKIEVVSLVIAFEPSDQTFKVLSEWFLLNVHKQVVFDIKVERNLIAGAEIFFNGKYLDFSVKPKFEHTLAMTLTPKATQTPVKPAGQQVVKHVSVTR